jgi:hypothetical protein
MLVVHKKSIKPNSELGELKVEPNLDSDSTPDSPGKTGGAEKKKVIIDVESVHAQ